MERSILTLEPCLTLFSSQDFSGSNDTFFEGIIVRIDAYAVEIRLLNTTGKAWLLTKNKLDENRVGQYVSGNCVFSDSVCIETELYLED